MIVYLARDIPAFVMYCVNGESHSSLLIESTDSMIKYTSGPNQARQYKKPEHLFSSEKIAARVGFETMTYRRC